MVQNDTLKFILNYDDKVSGTIISLRELLFKNLTGIKEELDIKTKIIGYGYGHRYTDTICVIIPSKKGVKLGFNRGIELPDPDKLLEGSGKVHKYAVINEEVIKSASLKKLLKEALKSYRKRIKI